jgi:hypothetical protein
MHSPSWRATKRCKTIGRAFAPRKVRFGTFLIDANGLWARGTLMYSRWFVRDITDRVDLEREILSVSEREQQRLGQDLHDDLCQQLSGIEFLSQTLARHLATTSKSGAARARTIARMIRLAIDSRARPGTRAVAGATGGRWTDSSLCSNWPPAPKGFFTSTVGCVVKRPC